MTRHTRLYTLVLAAAMLCGGAAQAGPVEPVRAADAARTFWVHTLHLKADATLVDRSAEWSFDGIYLFTCPQGGFVMVAADDNVRPILGYSPDGAIDARELPVQLQEWLTVYQMQIDWVRANDGRPYAADKAAWELLDKGLPLEDGSKSAVEPLLTTQWDQTAPYNMLCPQGTVTGCAATAQAQMMKYWNHPAVGYGSHSYVHNRYGAQGADFGHTVYDWANMPNKPTLVSPYRARLAVATLMYHCGVSLEMGYGTAAEGGSAAPGLAGMEGFTSIDNSLKNYFGYSRDMVVRFKNQPLMGQTYTNDEWRALLVAELDQRHPLVYTGAAEQGGHGFVCDGYDSRQYMHFNFGWSGTGDGYYPVDSISPGVGGAGGNVTYTFNMSNAALFGAVPVYELRVSDEIFYFGRDGGNDSLILCPNMSVNSEWSMDCDADWVSVEQAEEGNAVWLHFSVAAFESEETERVATLTFNQGNESVQVRVVQNNLQEEDLCPVTVVMESTRGENWQGGAYLSLESSGGYLFGTASLTEGSLDSVTINVAPHNVRAVWHSGGGTDRYVNYRVKNLYGETMVDVVSAYYDAGEHHIEWPCVHLGIRPGADEAEVRVWPNPASEVLHVDGLAGHCRIELHDMAGRTLRSTQAPTLNLQGLPKGCYLLRIVCEDSVWTEKIVKQ